MPLIKGHVYNISDGLCMKKSFRSLLPYILPALLIYTVFMAAPLFLSMQLSFYEWNGIGPKNFVGMENFRKLFSIEPWNIRFLNATKNNILLFLMVMFFQNIPAFLLAWLLHFKLKGRNIFRNIFFIPVTMSVIMVGYVAQLMFNPLWGSFNKLMEVVGLNFLSRPWLGQSETALFIVALVTAWQYIGIPLILFLSGLENIPKELTEAARIDGASELKILRYIYIPLLAPVFGIISILTFVGDFTAFEIIFAMEGSIAGPNYATDVFGTLFYRTSFGFMGSSQAQMGLGAAIAVCMFVIIGGAVLFWQWYDNLILKNLA